MRGLHRRQDGGRGIHLVGLGLLLLVVAACTVPVTVEWSTEVEMDTAGFDLYRGETPEGPFDVKVNDQLIPATDDPLAGGEYRYLDDTAQAGRIYYYILQEVERNGQVNTYGPIEVHASWLDARWVVVLVGLALVAAVAWFLALRPHRSQIPHSPPEP